MEKIKFSDLKGSRENNPGLILQRRDFQNFELII